MRFSYAEISPAVEKPAEGDDLFRHIHEVEILRGNIDGKKQVRIGFLPLGRNAARAPPHVPVHQGNHAVIFKHRNKRRRRKKSFRRMIPAHQYLGADRNA